MTDDELQPLSGSEREPMLGFRPAGAIPADESIEVSVILRPGGEAPAGASPQEVADARRAADADVEAVVAYAISRGLEVVEQHHHRRTVVLRGPASAMQAAFGVTLERYDGPGGASHRGRVGALSVPAGLVGVIVAVLGLDDRPQARPFLRVADERQRKHPAARQNGYDPVEVGDLYNFPAGLDGSGVTVAIIELGGGFDHADLATYFAEIGVQMPAITAVGVDGGSNTPRADPNADGEVCLDVEVVGALAPGAKQVVYFAPNTDRGFYDVISTAVHDTVNRPSLVSISWGGPESAWTAQAATAMDQLFADAAAMGVTVLAASGDSGAPDGVSDGLLHVTFPASSPSVLGCGGTRLVARATSISAETAWNDIAAGDGATGGGISDLFALPDYQAHAGVPKSANPGGRVGRGVPDVSGDADPVTGYRVRVDGQENVIGGTSAVAPLWAALLARCVQALGTPLGLVHARLYALSSLSGAFHDISAGDNAGYSATPGWDACTGLGSPDGTALLAALKGAHR
jgi:kumamolisin